MKKYRELLLVHLGKYAKHRLGVFEIGVYKDKTYAHVLPSRLQFLNLLEAFRSEMQDYLRKHRSIFSRILLPCAADKWHHICARIPSQPERRQRRNSSSDDGDTCLIVVGSIVVVSGLAKCIIHGSKSRVGFFRIRPQAKPIFQEYRYPSDVHLRRKPHGQIRYIHRSVIAHLNLSDARMCSV